MIIGSPAEQGKSPRSKPTSAVRAQNGAQDVSSIPEPVPDLAEQMNIAEKAKYIKGSTTQSPNITPIDGTR